MELDLLTQDRETLKSKLQLDDYKIVRMCEAIVTFLKTEHPELELPYDIAIFEERNAIRQRINELEQGD